MAKFSLPIYKGMNPILGGLYKFYYNPKVIGIENIPRHGRLVVVGNHKHVMDQCNIMCNTKRVIRYLAKKEYFDSNHAWFFQLFGCIPVDRSRKDNNAKSKALYILEHNHAIGLFPEGTRNSLKDPTIRKLYRFYRYEYSYKKFRKLIRKNNPKKTQVDILLKLYDRKKIKLKDLKDNLFDLDNYLKRILPEDKYLDSLLLPLKYGAVSMASKMDAYILPFGISGDYKFRSKNLVVKIGKPYKVSSNLVKENQILREKIIDLMQ